jgi:radical SAM superfamily enzyme YgiQ (UPF0313 family)
MPPMALLVLAAHARRAGWRVRVVDHNYEPLPDERPELAALSVWTSIAPQAYGVADFYRARGVPVVLGGVHASLLPGEALRHADAVVCGEADGVFPTVLEDALSGRLRRLYQGQWMGMEAVPTTDEWADILRSWPLRRYAPLNTLQTTRGCRFNCDFCSVIRINGRGSRHSSPERVVEELRVLKRTGQNLGDFTYVFFLDDDLAADLEYAALLFEAIVRSGIRLRWGAQASIGLARNPELLALARRSGCCVLFTGFESISRESLLAANKKNRPSEYGELVSRVHEAGITIEGGFIFGFDTDGPAVFDDTVAFVEEIGVDLAHFSILTPYPGTHTFARMAAEDRITSFDWGRYNLYEAVFTPARMSMAELEEGLARAYANFYGRGARWRRFMRYAWSRHPRFHLSIDLAAINYAKHYRFPVSAVASGYQAAPEDIAPLLQASAAPAQEALQIAFTNASSQMKRPSE